MSVTQHHFGDSIAWTIGAVAAFLGLVLVVLLVMTGCASSQGPQGASNDDTWTVTRQVVNGREVTCLSAYKVGLSCDWDHAKASSEMRDDMLQKGRHREALYAAQERRAREQQQRRRAAASTHVAGFRTPADAINHFRTVCGGDTTSNLRRLISRAKRRTHPDLGGSNDAFCRVIDAETLLRDLGRLA